MKNLALGLLVIAAVAGAYFALPGTRDGRAWASVSRHNTTADYGAYISDWPNGGHIQDARIRYDDCRWADVKGAAGSAPVQQYVQELPNGRHIRDARNRYDDCRWVEVKAAKDRAPLDQYVKELPNGRHVADAKQHIEMLAWNAARAVNLPASYRHYLASYPQGAHAGKARDRIAFILHDDAPYTAAKKAGSEEALRNFVANYAGHVRERDARMALSFCEGRDIVDLQNAGVIDTRVEGSRIQEVSLEVRRRVSYPVTVRVPVGTFFVANSSDVQNMVTTEATSTTLIDDQWGTVSVTTACANRPRHVPVSGNHFAIQRSPNQRELARLIPVLQQHGVDYTVRQAAVWIVTDDASYGDLQILVNSNTQMPVIDGNAAARAMKICAEAGINIKRKAIWSDRGSLRQEVHDADLKRWLR